MPPSQPLTSTPEPEPYEESVSISLDFYSTYALTAWESVFDQNAWTERSQIVLLAQWGIGKYFIRPLLFDLWPVHSNRQEHQYQTLWTWLLLVVELVPYIT